VRRRRRADKAHQPAAAAYCESNKKILQQSVKIGARRRADALERSVSPPLIFNPRSRPRVNSIIRLFPEEEKRPRDPFSDFQSSRLILILCYVSDCAAWFRTKNLCGINAFVYTQNGDAIPAHPQSLKPRIAFRRHAHR
jgi:hypothetical protein